MFCVFVSALLVYIICSKNNKASYPPPPSGDQFHEVSLSFSFSFADSGYTFLISRKQVNKFSACI